MLRSSPPAATPTSAATTVAPGCKPEGPRYHPSTRPVPVPPSGPTWPAPSGRTARCTWLLPARRREAIEGRPMPSCREAPTWGAGAQRHPRPELRPALPWRRCGPQRAHRRGLLRLPYGPSRWASAPGSDWRWRAWPPWRQRGCRAAPRRSSPCGCCPGARRLPILGLVAITRASRRLRPGCRRWPEWHLCGKRHRHPGRRSRPGGADVEPARPRPRPRQPQRRATTVFDAGDQALDPTALVAWRVA